MLFADKTSSFGCAVGVIVLVCSQKQMIRIYAGPIVAFMANQHSLRDWRIKNLPRYSMRFFIFARGKKKTVPMKLKITPIPDPTPGIWFRYIRFMKSLRLDFG